MRQTGEGDSRPPAMSGFLRSWTGIALCVFMGAVLVLLWLEHRAHLAGALPLLLLLVVCVGMHALLHRGHGHGGPPGGPGNHRNGR